MESTAVEIRKRTPSFALFTSLLMLLNLPLVLASLSLLLKPFLCQRLGITEHVEVRVRRLEITRAYSKRALRER